MQGQQLLVLMEARPAQLAIVMQMSRQESRSSAGPDPVTLQALITWLACQVRAFEKMMSRDEISNSKAISMTLCAGIFSMSMPPGRLPLTLLT